VRSSADTKSADPSGGEIPFVKLDPQFPVTLAGKPLNIPEPTYKLDVLLKARRAEAARLLDEHDEDDASVFAHGITPPAREREGTRAKPVVVSDDEDDDPDDYDESWADDDAGPVPGPSVPRTSAAAPPARRAPVDDWTHDADWVQQAVEHLILPPQQSSPMATKAIQRELKAMLDEQGKAHSLKELGWYLPLSIIENQENLFQWIVGA
jgi:ubiquitin-conjugating enzyme E2 Q